MEKISNKFHPWALTIIIRFGDFRKHSIKPWKSWLNFLMFQSISIFAICGNRRRENVSVLNIDLNNKSKALSFGIQLLRTQVLAL